MLIILAHFQEMTSLPRNSVDSPKLLQGHKEDSEKFLADILNRGAGKLLKQLRWVGRLRATMDKVYAVASRPSRYSFTLPRGQPLLTDLIDSRRSASAHLQLQTSLHIS